MHSQPTPTAVDRPDPAPPPYCFSADETAALPALMDGFIHHPRSVPVAVALQPPAAWRRRNAAESPSHLGILFYSDVHLPAGNYATLKFSVRGEPQQFYGEIVFVRAYSEGYLVGLWLQNDNDARRARIVEQLCHMERYLDHRCRDRAVTPDRDRVAHEWVTRFAHQFPA